MRFSLILNIAFVVVPTAGIAWRAWESAGVEGERRVAARRELAEDYAKDVANHTEGLIRYALTRERGFGVVAYSEGGRLLYAPPLAEKAVDSATTEERAWYRLSKRGGESFAATRDHAAALDAYTFHLPRIRSAELRARLRLAAARAASEAGEPTLARALLLELFEGGAGDAITDEGYRIDLVAASMLLARGADTPGDLRDRAAKRLSEKAPWLRTPVLAQWMEALAPADERLRAIVEERRLLEAAVAARPEVLAAKDTILADSTVVHARDETAAGRRVRALRAASIALAAPYPISGMEVTWLEPGAVAADKDTVIRDFSAFFGGVPLGSVAVRDAGLAAERRAESHIRSNDKTYVMLFCWFILIGAISIFQHIRQERELTRLRLRLLANVSHELKTPVTSIRMFAEMLSGNGTDPARAEGFARHILRESERLSRLVEDVLDTARPERAMEALHPEPVDVAALIRTLAGAFAERAREAGVDFRLEGVDPTQGEAVVDTSAPAVERILSNLLDNALKYRRPEDARIVLALDRVGPGVRVGVRDNGPGIAMKDRARVFDEFYRARYDDYAVKGAGLGLAIARRLARKLGGDIRVDSKEGKGSTFTLRLPARAPSGAGARGA